MTVQLLPLAEHPDMVRHVTHNLREWDRREIFALQYGDDPEDLARRTLDAGSFSWVAVVDEAPVACIGATPVRPGVWSVWCFGTDAFDRAALTLTKHVRRVMVPALERTGAHRADCLSMAGHTTAQRWLLSLGALPEARLRQYGRDQEDFIIFSWWGQPCAKAAARQAEQTML